MARKRGKVPTLRDVAELAGTSTAVVSYVVNSGPRPVAADTRERVVAAISELGYRPNRAARTLVSNRSYALGLVVPDTSNAFFSDLVRAVERYARSKKLITLIGNTEYDPATERGYVEAFEDYGADGIIVVSADLREPWTAAVSTPLVFVHRRPAGAEGPLVRSDDRLGGILATQHLIATGRGPIHCVAGHEDAGPIEDRVSAWRECQTELGRQDSAELVRVGYPRAAAAAELAPWLGALALPAAVFVTTDEQAIGLLSAATTAGLRIPEDLAIAGYDDTSAAAFAVPSLTTVRVPYEEMARRAVDCVLLGDDPSETYCGDVQLIVRQSCGGSDSAAPTSGAGSFRP